MMLIQNSLENTNTVAKTKCSQVCVHTACTVQIIQVEVLMAAAEQVQYLYKPNNTFLQGQEEIYHLQLPAHPTTLPL